MLCALKLDFDDFDLEESENCKYDSLTVFGDIDGKDEIGKVQNIYLNVNNEVLQSEITFLFG